MSGTGASTVQEGGEMSVIGTAKDGEEMSGTSLSSCAGAIMSSRNAKSNIVWQVTGSKQFIET